MNMSVVTLLDQTRSRLRRMLWWRGLATCAAILIFGAVLFALLDWWRPVSGVIRTGLLVGLVAVLWWQLRRRLWRPLQPSHWSEIDMARLIERRIPQLNGRLVSHVELGYESSGRLSTPHIPSIDQEAAHISPSFFQAGGLWQTSWRTPIGSAACLLAILLAVMAPTWSRIALQRTLMPWSSVAWPDTVAYTLTLEQGPLTFADRPLWVRIDRQYGDSEPLTMSWRSLNALDENAQDESEAVDTQAATSLNDPRWSHRELGLTAGGQWRQRLQLPPGKWGLLVSSAGGTSSMQVVDVLAPPQWQPALVAISPPAYTGLPEQSQSLTAELSLWPGSDVAMQFQVQLPQVPPQWHLSEVSLLLQSDAAPDESIALAMSPYSGAAANADNGNSAEALAQHQLYEATWQHTALLPSAASTATSSTAATSSLTHAWTATLQAEIQPSSSALDPLASPQQVVSDALQWSFRLKSDHAPVVRLDGVRAREAVAVSASVPLSVVAQDDVALADLGLLIQATTPKTLISSASNSSLRRYLTLPAMIQPKQPITHR